MSCRYGKPKTFSNLAVTLQCIFIYHIEAHCCGRRIPSDVVSRNQTFSIYTVLSTMCFNMVSLPSGGQACSCDFAHPGN